MDAVELELPPRSVYVGVARLALTALARAAGMAEEAVDDLRIAISEACTNAALSNEGAGTDAPVTVSWRVDGTVAVVEVWDRGDLYSSRDEGRSLDEASGRVAMSAVLLESLADGVEFVPRDGGGTCARLRFALT